MPRWSRRALLVPAVAAVQFALLEGVLAWFLNHPHHLPGALVPAFRDYYRLEEWRNMQLDPASGRYDPELTYTLLPGAFRFVSREFDSLYRVNSEGLRDDEESLDAPEIIVVGDSHAMGWGVEQHETWVHLLEESLGRRILNAGVPSYGTAREMKLLERLDASRLEVLIVQYCGNDYRENRRWVEGGGSIQIMDRGQYRATVRGHLGRLAYRFGKHTIGIARALLGNSGGIALPSAGEPGPEDEAEAFLQILASGPLDLDELIVVVLELNANAQNDRDFLGRLEAELAGRAPGERTRVVTVDVSDVVDEDDYYILDTHMRPAGHVAVAGRLAPAVAELITD
jgi:lysophospholipase L1-like esterase